MSDSERLTVTMEVTVRDASYPSTTHIRVTQSATCDPEEDDIDSLMQELGLAALQRAGEQTAALFGEEPNSIESPNGGSNN